MSSGEKIYQVFLFYIEQLVKVFNIMDSFEILPNISYLDLLISVSIITILVKIITFGLKTSSFIQQVKPEYRGKHEYKGKHEKGRE